MNRQSLLTWLAIGWAAVLLSSVVSMMAVFMGSQSGDTAALLQFQATLLPLTAAALLYYWRRACRLGDGLRSLWQHTPGWLVFAVASAASLVLIAELSFVLISLHGEKSRPFVEHVPALTAMLSSVALASGYALLKLEENAA